MISDYLDRLVRNVPGLEDVASRIAGSIHRAVLAGGEPVREGVDLLHGTWLGHPLHPAMTDVPIGAWSSALLFDGIAANREAPYAERAADILILAGAVTALPTAITGLADYSVIYKSSAPIGLAHAVANNIALVLYLLSLWNRKQGRRGVGLFCSTLAYLILLLGAWLGGHLVYKHRVGMDHSSRPSSSTDWRAVLDESGLGEGSARRVEVEGEAVLLYRHQGSIHAIGAVCSHAGGPLEEGSFDGYCVQCPWHDSVFDLRDGRNVHGPSVYPQPTYETRVRDGKIEVRYEKKQK